MIWLAVVCALGLPAGFLLLWRMPRCGTSASTPAQPVFVVIPARNEERNLPRLLASLTPGAPKGLEILVVDDASTDGTASVAQAMGARVVVPRPLPAGWTGKTWACSEGAAAATAEQLLFVDADTYFEPGGLQRMIASQRSGQDVALSLLPYHAMREPYEQLSLVFNLLMAFGAGGFGVLGGAKLFGQSLFLSRALYDKSGGHAAVRGSILENLRMAANLRAAGGVCVCLGGRGTLNIRMFPHGFKQLCEGWSKAFADGAAASDAPVLACTIMWLTALCATFLCAVFAPGGWHLFFAAGYALFVLQLAWLARQIGSYHWYSFVLYPLPLLFFFAIFFLSLWRRTFKRKATWRGRQV